jgi:hypothetical protein
MRGEGRAAGFPVKTGTQGAQNARLHNAEKAAAGLPHCKDGYLKVAATREERRLDLE